MRSLQYTYSEFAWRTIIYCVCAGTTNHAKQFLYVQQPRSDRDDYIGIPTVRLALSHSKQSRGAAIVVANAIVHVASETVP